MTIRRGLDNSFIKGPSEKIRSSSKEEIAQQQNTIEIELNKNKINNTSYDKQSFNNTEEDISQLATQYNVKGKESESVWGSSTVNVGNDYKPGVQGNMCIALILKIRRSDSGRLARIK